MSAGSNQAALMVDRDPRRLAPAFAEAVRLALAECNSGPNPLGAMLYEGYRSPELQAMYYKRGRTVIPPLTTVTNAQTNLQSWHGYGLAVDIVHEKKFWSPPEGEKWFHKVAAIFKKHGCAWGGDWKSADLPHFQWGRCTASPSKSAQDLITSDGMQAVWRRLEAIDGTPS